MVTAWLDAWINANLDGIDVCLFFEAERELLKLDEDLRFLCTFSIDRVETLFWF